MKIVAVLFALAFVFVVSKFPLTFRGEPADFTFAIANQDMPSGIYYGRDFDWPSGEAVWLDVPVWVADFFLLITAIFLWRPAFSNRSSPADSGAARPADGLSRIKQSGGNIV